MRTKPIYVSFKNCIVKPNNLKNLERRLIRIKANLEFAPKEMKREFAWEILKESFRNDFKGVMWLYDELSKFVDEKFR